MFLKGSLPGLPKREERTPLLFLKKDSVIDRISHRTWATAFKGVCRPDQANRGRAAVHPADVRDVFFGAGWLLLLQLLHLLLLQQNE